MNFRKNGTAAKYAVNKKNAKTSTGPKSSQGKCRTKNNAITHGLFAKEKE